jgi:hypothetical protein
LEALAPEYQPLTIRIIEMKVKLSPNPTSDLPSTAYSSVGANATVSCPIAITAAPTDKSSFAPYLSSKIPTGICMAA